MSSDVDAVIAALRIVQREAEQRSPSVQGNRARQSMDRTTSRRIVGTIEDLRLKSVYTNRVYRDELLRPVRDKLAYPETNRNKIKAMRLRPWPSRKSEPPAEPIDAEFKEVADPPDR
jgi:hypothetical protein